MAKRKNGKKNKKQKAPTTESGGQVVPDIANILSVPDIVDQNLSLCHEDHELASDLDEHRDRSTPEPRDTADDDAVVPGSPVSLRPDEANDSPDPVRYLAKDVFVPEPRHNTSVEPVSPVKEQPIDGGKGRTTEKAEKRSRVSKKSQIPDARHPLKDMWVFWYYQGDKKKSWQENLLEVKGFDTIEDFWSLHNYIIPPSSLQPGRDYNLFKKGIRPEWEDAHNTGGGMWSVTLRERRMRSPEMDAVWAEVIMLLVGNQFDHLASFVNGATYSARKNQDRVSLWVRADLDRNRDEIQAIGERLRKAVQFAGNNFVLEYATSDDWKNKAGPTVSARIILHMQ